MKKLLLMFTIVSLSILGSGFKKIGGGDNFKSMLCDKLWVTNGVNDPKAEVIIEFKSNQTYVHKYMLKDAPTLYSGKWSIGKDKKIYIQFDSTKASDVYEVVSINNSKLEIQTASAGLKKLDLKK
jgi:hypothetical protein